MPPICDRNGCAVRVSPIPGWLTCGLAVLLLAACGFSAQAAQPKRVLLLHSYGREYAPFNAFAETFRTELAQRHGEPLEFHDAALESARFEGDMSEGPLTVYLGSLFAGRRLDLVVPIGGPAARLALRHRESLFPETPMLVAAVDQRHLQQAALGRNETAVAVSNDFPRVIESILQVLPATTNIAVVIGNSPLERFWTAELGRQFASYSNRLSFAWFNEGSFGDLKRRAASLPPGTAILYVVFSVDTDGVPYIEEQALAGLHSVASVPIFGLQASQLGRGIVGGPLMGFEELSRNTAAVASRILRGEAAGNIKTPVQQPGNPVYDWRELRRWGISESRLPAGSEVRFRQVSVWQRYWWQIMAATSFVAAQGLLVIALLANLARRRQAEIRLRKLSGRLIRAQEEERARVAKELHDGLSQDLALIAVELDLCGQKPPAEMAQARARMPELSARLREVSGEVHRISHALHPAKLQQLGLAAAIGGFCRELEAGGNIAVRFAARDVPRTLPNEIALCLYRVAQEALQNVVKHSGASAARVELTGSGDAIHLMVSDQGKGFDVQSAQASSSLGLTSMRERILLVHGRIEIDSEAGQGTRIAAHTPLGGGSVA